MLYHISCVSITKILKSHIGEIKVNIVDILSLLVKRMRLGVLLISRMHLVASNMIQVFYQLKWNDYSG